MLTKDDLRDALLKECDICLHLFEKIPAGGMEYRPTPGQRNTAELLRYISYCGIGGCHAMNDGNWDGYKRVAERGAEMAPEEFPAHMERQKQEITAFFDGLTDDEVATRTTTDPMGNELPLGHALFYMPVRWMGGYRMQLFLYAKQAGNADIWTPNCWMGIDYERPPAEG